MKVLILLAFFGLILTAKVATTETTTIPTTTTISTTTLSPLKCGDFLPLGSTYNPTDPNFPGLPSGTYVDNSTIYPGFVFLGDCGGDRPSRISIKGSAVSVFSPCNFGERIGTNPRYYYKHPDLSWFTTNISSVEKVNGLFSNNLVVHDTYKFFVARFNFTKNGTPYQGIGFYYPTAKSIEFIDGTNAIVRSDYTENFDVLTCPLCFNLIKYDPTVNPNEPETRGFPSGTFYDGSIIYPGIANGNCSNQNPSTARITTTSKKQGPGGYVSCADNPALERFDKTTAYFFENSPRLKWVATTGSTYTKIPGIIPIKSTFGTLYVGRINITLTNGTTYQQISKIAGDKIWYTLPNVLQEQTATTGFEILACQ